tara:strand:- start:1011 stop:2456 length:1446 start_codon:yes stop_codon:yes gene_type:complete
MSTPAAVSDSNEQTAAAASAAALVARGRAAMAALANASQERVDEAVTAIAWAVYDPENARALAELAVEDTGLGNVPDKIIKNQRKTFGTLRDLMRVRTVGVIEDLPEKGLVKYAKPVGVVAAVTPSTNPAATPVNKTMMALKGRNAVVVAASPSGYATTCRTVDLMRAALDQIGLPVDLIQVLPQPVSKASTQALMEAVDLVVVTGSQNNVRRAYSSGTPAIGVGAGNVPVIIDESADLDDAATKICASKTFDNATSCSSENSVIIPESIYEDAMAALKRAGGFRCDAQAKARVLGALWPNGSLSRDLIAKDADVFAERVGLPAEAQDARFFMVEDDGVGHDYPLSGEKLSLVLTVYKVADFAAAKAKVQEVLDHEGMGHSCGIHTHDHGRAQQLAQELNVVRVLVNQAHTFGNGGSFDNGLNFTLSMGCGSWAGNSITENLNYKHFINVTHLSTTIPEDKPTEDALFGAYWDKYNLRPDA